MGSFMKCLILAGVMTAFATSASAQDRVVAGVGAVKCGDLLPALSGKQGTTGVRSMTLDWTLGYLSALNEEAAAIHGGADSNLKCNTCYQVRFADVITSFVLVLSTTSA